MTERWWRAYDECLHDPKLIALPDRLHRAWFNLLCVASKNGGVLPGIATVAIELRTTTQKAAEYITALVVAELIDEIEGKFAPHNWNGRQYKSDVTDPTNAKRQKRYRDRHRNGSNAVTSNSTEPLRERLNNGPQSTETENRDSEANASGADAPLDPSIAERELFEQGKALLGKSAGGQIVKLLRAKGGNVSLARAAIETAKTKENPAEYVAAAIRGPPADRPLTLTEQNRRNWRNTEEKLDDAIDRLSGSGQGGPALIEIFSEGGRSRPGSDGDGDDRDPVAISTGRR